MSQKPAKGRGEVRRVRKLVEMNGQLLKTKHEGKKFAGINLPVCNTKH